MRFGIRLAVPPMSKRALARQQVIRCTFHILEQIAVIFTNEQGRCGMQDIEDSYTTFDPFQ